MAEKLAKKKKKWISVFNQDFDSEIGETLANEDADITGRTMEVNLANLTRDPKLQNIKIKFRIKEVKENKAYAELISYSMLSTYVKRIMRPAKEKIDDSFKYVTKDNVNAVVKTLILTKSKTKKSILTHIRDESHKLLQDYFKKNDYKSLIRDLASHNLQKDLKNSLKRVYPLSICEIRMMQRL